MKRIPRQEVADGLRLAVSYGVTSLLGIAYVVYSGRVLGPRVFAELASIVALTTFFYTSSGPINGTIAHFTSRYLARGEEGKARRLFRDWNRMILAGIAIATVVAMPGARPVASWLQLSSAWTVGLAWSLVALNLLAGSPRGVLRGAHLFGRLGFNLVTEASVRLVAGVALLALAPSVTSALLGYLVALALACGVAFRQTSIAWKDAPPDSAPSHPARGFAVGMLVLMLTTAGYQNLDMLLVRRFFADAETGYFGAALSLARVVGMIAAPFTVMILPLLSRQRERGLSIVAPLTRLIGYVVAGAALPLLLFALAPAPVVRWTYGSDFAAASDLLLPIAASRLIGFLAYLLALAGAALEQFRTLWVYLPALVVQTSIIVLWHPTLLAVVLTTLVTQSLVVVGIVATLRPAAVPASLAVRELGDSVPGTES